VKNFWNSYIKKKLIAQGLDPKTHNLTPAASRVASNNNNNVTNLSQFQQSQISTTIPFTISSEIKSFDTSKSSSLDNIVNPPFVTLPTSSNLGLHDATMPTSTFQYNQDPNVFMIDYANCSSSSLDQTNLSSSYNHSEFMDEACMWGTSYGVEALEAPKQNGLEAGFQMQGQGQGQGQAHNINEERGAEMEMSYNSTIFDLELTDSALMPCGMFSSGSSMEELQWDC